MAAGFSTALANSLLDAFCNATSYSETNTYAKLHTGNPGTAGTANASVETTRKLLSFAAATSGSITLDTTASWTSWPVGANGETIAYISVWDDVSAGNFLYSVQLTSGRTLNTGDTLNLTDLDITITTAS